jgi:membrane-associated phospholipid phosphatase
MPNQADQSKRLRITRVRGIVVVGAFAVAFALDMATGRRFSAVWGSGAIVASALALVPALRSVAVPTGAYIAIWTGFNVLRGLADAVPWRNATTGLVAGWESRLFGGDLPSTTLQRRIEEAPMTGVTVACATAVYLSYFIVPHVVAIRLLLRARRSFWRYAAATAILFAIGVAWFTLLPTSPPWLAAPDDGSGARRIVSSLVADLGIGSESASGSARSSYAFDPNPVASIPSIHLGVTMLLVPLARGTGWRIAAGAYAAAMGISLVSLGEHYLLDILGGACAALVAWMSMRRLEGMRDRGRARPIAIAVRLSPHSRSRLADPT